MNQQQLLFKRVGFTVHTLSLLSDFAKDKAVSDRTLRAWVNGEFIPRNPYYFDTATALDEHLTEKAKYLIDTHNSNIMIVPVYSDEDDYLNRTGEFMPLDVYQALVQRLIIVAAGEIDIILEIDTDDYKKYGTVRDWYNYIPLNVGFAF